jgi:nicotinamide-nucleotide amidase
VKAAVCSVGTELLVGDVADTNAAWLSRRLTEVGAEVAWHLAVGDEHGRIVAALRWLVERADVVVVGGGLGPTPDDLTRAAVAEVAGVELEVRDELAARIEAVFARAGRPMPRSNLRQARLPAGATAFEPVGTAPGFAVQVGRGSGGPCLLYALPGVPFELQAMTEREVLPDLLRRRGGTATVTRTVHVAGMGESSVSEALAELTDRLERAAGDGPDPRRGIAVAFLAGPDEVRVKLTAAAATPEAAAERLGPAVDQVVARLGPAVAGVDDERLEHAVARLLRLTALTVATAESCTAGAVAARLAAVPGASRYLRGGVVAYATEAKSRLLGVDPAVLAEHGPVSAATSEAMARAVRQQLEVDVGVAVTCVAGPEGQGGQAVGTVFTALAVPDGSVRARQLHILGDRPTVQARAAAVCLERLRRHLARLLAAGQSGQAVG